jgi:hypothetical protein
MDAREDWQGLRNPSLSLDYVSRPPVSPTHKKMKLPVFFSWRDKFILQRTYIFLPEGVLILAQDKRSAALGKRQ